MKFFVARINLVSPETLEDSINICKSAITKIDQDAKAKMGDDVITIVVLPEYYLTGKSPISNDLRNKIVKEFHDLIKTFKNVIFIPGTFASQKEVEGEKFEKRKSKQQERYSDLSQEMSTLSKYDYENNRGIERFTYENTKFEKMLKEGNQKQSFLTNSAYIIIQDKIIKHQKTVPFDETTFSTHSIFHLGKGKYVHDIDLNGNQIKLGLLICREKVHPNINQLMKNNAPLVEVLVSNSTSSEKGKMNGALNIHCDIQEERSCCYVNEHHPKNNDIDMVEYRTYTINSRSNVMSIFGYDMDEEEGEECYQNNISRNGWQAFACNGKSTESYILLERVSFAYQNSSFKNKI